MRLANRLASKVLAVTVAAGTLATPLVVTGATAASAATCPAPGGTDIAEAAVPTGAEVAFLGHGYGHSIGMSQYGAQGAARLGCTHAQILGTYYAGTVLAKRTSPAEVRVRMLINGTHANVLAEDGPVSWKLSGCTTACPPVQPELANWRVRTDAAETFFELVDLATGARVWAGGARGATLTAAHSGSVIDVDSFKGATAYLSRRLRWDETRYTFDSYGLDAVQAIRGGHVAELGRTLSAMDKYLWGLSEVPLSWTRDAHEALRTQVIAARTYATSKINAGVIILPTTVHQHYTGYTKEYEDRVYKDQYGRNYRWADAVLSTSETVVHTSTGVLVDTFFTSSHGGFSEDNRYVWGGTSDISYIRPFDDSTWDAKSSGGTYRSWARGFTKATVATKLGFDSITSISIAAQGTTARHAGLKVVGMDNGVLTTRYFTGDTARGKLSLPSPGFVVVVPAATATATAVTVPGAPALRPAAHGVAGGAVNATAFWTAPKSNGGAAITGYRVRAERLSRTGRVVSTSMSKLLPVSRAYYTMTLTSGKVRFSVQAVNNKGAGKWSAFSTVVVAR